MKILLDMNLSPALVQKLSSLTHTAIHWSEVGDARAADREIMTSARPNDLTILGFVLLIRALMHPATTFIESLERWAWHPSQEILARPTGSTPPPGKRRNHNPE